MPVEIKFHISDPAQKFSPAAKELLKQAAEIVWPGETYQFRQAPAGFDTIIFGRSDPYLCSTLSPNEIVVHPNALAFLEAAFRDYSGLRPSHTPMPWPDVDLNDILFFDIESHSVDDRWRMDPREFFRLGQYAWGPRGDVTLTTDYDEMIWCIRNAAGVIGQNIHAFDLSVLFGKDSTEPLEMAMENHIFDTMVYAALLHPAPESYTDRHGRRHINANKPENALKWLSLDNLSYQLNTPGKEGDLSALARKYGGYGKIPTDDPEYREYAEQDVVALQHLADALLSVQTPTEYDWREQLNAAIDAQNSRNGFRVDIARAEARRDELAIRREALMVTLQTKYGLPSEGKMPWRTNEGKAAILKALADEGIVPEEIEGWTRTKTGNISLGGEVLIEQTLGTPAEDLGQALAEVMGQRSLAQLALDSVQPDGKVHPEITALQRSGRKSTTKPGLTVWSSRGEKAVEKEYFIADPGCKLVELDYSQADARIVAALSGDEAFKERFAEGSDAHEITGRVVFEEEYDTDPVVFRHRSKALGHAYTYRAAAKKLAQTAKQPLKIAEKFVNKMSKAYPLVTKWQDKVTAEAAEHGYVINDWGRKMQVERKRAYTQAPAMYGQSGTRELMVDALIRMAYYDIRLIQWLKAQVHDALVASVPEEHLHWAVPKMRELMTCDWKPKEGGQLIHFPVGVGEPADDWRNAGHE